MVSYSKAFSTAAKGLDKEMGQSHERVREHVQVTDENIFEGEADAVNYVMNVGPCSWDDFGPG